MTRFWSLVFLLAPLPALTAPDPGPGTEPAIVIDRQAVEELAGAATVAEFSARFEPAPPLADESLFAPLVSDAGDQADAGKGETLQILYARGSLVISPSAEATLKDWSESFLSPESKVEILSYSGTITAGLRASSHNPGNDIMTYSLHEAIRTAFKRAIVVRDILIDQGLSEDNITVRALGPSTDDGPPERIDVVALDG